MCPQPVRYFFTLLFFALLGVDLLARDSNEPHVSDPVIYDGICGASAGAVINSDLFIVADDEANQLRVYRRQGGGGPMQVFDLSRQLELQHHAPETDIEGAARMGNRIYWITSHSRNHQGKDHPNRCRFFATEVSVTNGIVSLAFVGRPDKDLLRDLISAPVLKPFKLEAAARLAPKAPGALNIEGLCATPDGRLLIGFRNPIPGGRALIVPLDNPDELLAGKAARFGQPVLLDLGGLGIRDMGLWNGTYYLIAGPYDGVGKSKFFSWAGGQSAARHLKEVDLKGLNPEAIIIYPDQGSHEIQLLSDDSAHQAGKVPCNQLSEDARHFRSVTVRLTSKHHKPRI